jgi:hypothetical protein
MIEQITTAIANPAFGDTVLPRALETCPLRLNGKGFDRVRDLFIEI